VRLGVAGANEKIIGNRGNLADIENEDVFGFLVERDLAAEFGEFAGVEVLDILH
jgi:hypothetical protein